MINKDKEAVSRLPSGRWFALGSVGHGFPSATARRLYRVGLLERRLAPFGFSRLYDYRLTEAGERLKHSTAKGE